MVEGQEHIKHSIIELMLPYVLSYQQNWINFQIKMANEKIKLMKPILFTPTNSTLSETGIKTMTRRYLKKQLPIKNEFDNVIENIAYKKAKQDALDLYHVGDVLYEKENHYYRKQTDVPGFHREEIFYLDHEESKQIAVNYINPQPPPIGHTNGIHTTIEPKPLGKKRSKLFMPKWAARKFYEVISVKVERLQDISVEDCKKEGIRYKGFNSFRHECYLGAEKFQYRDVDLYKYGFNAYVMAYWSVWDGINIKFPGKRWEDNPWVIAIEYKKRSIDELKKLGML